MNRFVSSTCTYMCGDVNIVPILWLTKINTDILYTVLVKIKYTSL